MTSCFKYSRRQYKVSVSYRLPTVPYFKKKPSKTVPFYSAGRDAVIHDPNIGRSQVSSGFFFSVYAIAVLPACFLLGRSAPVYRLFLLFSSINRFSSRQFRSSSSITSALLLMDLGGVRRKMARKNCERINAVKTVTFF